MANIGLLAERLVAIEQAWERGDDETLLETLRDWGWKGDPLLDMLFLELAVEDEERTFQIYRQWVRGRLRETRRWQEDVAHARDRLALYELIRDELIEQGRYARLDLLMEKQWRIIVEEGEAYARERGM